MGSLENATKELEDVIQLYAKAIQLDEKANSLFSEIQDKKALTKQLKQLLSEIEDYKTKQESK